MEQRERLAALRAEMKQQGVDIYLIPTADFHNSEYVGEYFKVRRYITGFTGSAGTAVVTADQAGLWTDGRYFIQAAAELEGSGFELYRMGVEGVPPSGSLSGRICRSMAFWDLTDGPWTPPRRTNCALSWRKSREPCL